MSAAKLPAAKRIKLSDQQMNLIAKALADPRRYELLRQIGRRDAATRCEAIRSCHAVSAATLSHHMKELENAGLVQVVREGRFASYTLLRNVLQAYTEALAKL